jgi:clan AA aspartic protease
VNGEVDNAGRATILLSVRASSAAAPIRLTTWVDTAFTGELVLPRKIVEKLGLQQSAAVKAGLADGTQVVLETYECIVDWFGERRTIQAVANDGQIPLLGIGLLQGRKLEVDYRLRTVSID